MPGHSLNRTVLYALMQYDDALRTGRSGDTLPLNDDSEFLESYELGQRALNELEAALPRHSKALPSWAPKKIGRFELRSVLGSGGFAVVYLAEDPSLNRMVALKVPRLHALVQADLRRRFVIEAQAAAKLDHANIVPVYEAGQDGDLPYIACAWCDGPTLAAWMSSRTSPLRPVLAATIVRQLASAVCCSHESGILHRDIKPGNVLLFPHASGTSAEFPYIPRLGDFGLAKLLESGEFETMTSQLAGTPRYMAPELLGAFAQPSDAAVDIYALGAVLYCLIVGQPPFVSATAAETFRQIAECSPVPPEIINPGIGRDLSRICMKCLEKLPRQRYATAADFAADLDRYLSGRPVHARSTPLPVRVQKWCRQRPLVSSLLLISGCLVSALLMMAVAYTGSLRTLRGKLENSNTQLKQRVTELAAAVEVANSSTVEANEQRQFAERLLFAADVQHASLIWKKGDVRETVRILSKYANADHTSDVICGPESFAWRWLWNHATTPFQNVYDSKQSVWWMQPSPDGRQLAVCGSKGQLQFLAIEREFGLDRVLDAGSAEIGCVSFSEDMQLMATAADDGLIRIYDQQTPGPGPIIEAIPGKRVFCVSFLPGSHQIVACGESNSLILGDADTGELLSEIETPFARFIEFMTLSPDGSRLLMAGSDGRVVQLNTADFSVFCHRVVSLRTMAMARYSYDGTIIACAGADKTLRLLDAETEDELLSYENLDSIHTVLMTPDNHVVIGDRGGVLSAFRLPVQGARPETQAWRPGLRWAGHDSPVSAMIWIENTPGAGGTTGQVVSADRSGRLRSWEIVRGVDREAISSPLTDIGTWCDATCVSHGRGEVLRGGPNGVEVFNLNSLERISSHCPGHFISSICCARLSGQIIAGDRSGRLLKFSSPLSEPVGQIQVFPHGDIERLMVDDRAEFAVALSDLKELAVVDILQETVLKKLPDRAASAISPNGKWVASARHGRDDVEVFAREDMNSVALLPAHQSTVVQVLFSPDGEYLLTTSHDRMITIWSCQTWQLTHKLSGHQSPVRAAGISSDGKILATGDQQGLIKLWDYVGGRELLEIDQPVADVRGLQFSSDGKQLIAWDSNMTLTILQSPDNTQYVQETAPATHF